MLARLGHVLYWAATAVAALLAIAAIPAARNETTDSGRWLVLAFFLICAALVWLFGRACRYVLSGR